MQDIPTEEIAPVTADMLSEPLTDTAPHRECVPDSASFGFGDIEPAPALETTEHEESSAELAELDEEMDETPLEEISTPEQENVICEQTPEFISFGGFTSEATRHFAVPEEIKPPAGLAVPSEITANIDFAGEVEQVSPGELRLPVTIRYGEETKRIAINLKLSIETLEN